MSFRDIPVIILVLATIYLISVYLLLILAQRSSRASRSLLGTGLDSKRLLSKDSVPRGTRTIDAQ